MRDFCRLTNEGAFHFARRWDENAPWCVCIHFVMANYQVKVKYGEERFSTFLIKDISFEKLIREIKKNCSPLTYLHSSNIRVRYRDEDGDMINLSPDDQNGFAFQEMLRSAKEVTDRDYRKIYLQANEINSPIPRKVRRTDLETPNTSSLEHETVLQPKHLSFTSPGAPPAQTYAERSPLDSKRQEMEENLQVLKVQVATAKQELENLNTASKEFQSLSDIRARICNNCHGGNHTKATCSGPPCTDINICKIKEKHPEHKAKITQLQREIKSLEKKAQEEETHLKSYTAARERTKSSFFAVMRPRLKAQNSVKYGSGNRARLDRDLLVLQRAIKKVPEWSETEDWRLPLIIEQYEQSNVNMFLNSNFEV